MKVNREFYNRDTLMVAEEILGKLLVHKTEDGVVKGKIVEVEVYMGPDDKAAHSYGNRKSERTKIQYGEGGYAYVYLIYGMHCCMNIVTNTSEKPESILIRALEPVEGIELMKKRRKTSNLRMLCNGPGKLSQAMGITRENYGDDLCGDSLYLEYREPLPKENVVRTKRINIDYAQEARDYLWRFVVKDNPYVSGFRF